MTIASTWVRLAAAGLLGLLAAGGLPGSSHADNAAPAGQSAPQTSTSPPAVVGPGAQAQPPSPGPAPSAQPPAASTPGTAPQQPGAGPAPARPDVAKPSETGKPPEGSTGETVELAPRPFAFIEGKADRDEVYAAIQGSLSLVRRDLDKAGVKPAGRPLAVFVESDETGFRYHAGYPIEAAAAAGKSGLSDAVKIGVTPSGKAMRFQHLGAYADIDATYDAITAYLDDKGIDAQDSFVEEYANDIKDADDPNLEVDIYVLLK